MEENQIQANETSVADAFEPEQSDNSQAEKTEAVSETESVEKIDEKEGQSLEKDPSEELILGKFKSVEDLTKAYEELQKYQGTCSEELGQLRKVASTYEGLCTFMNNFDRQFRQCLSDLEEIKQKYDTPEYFQNPNFKAIYSAAYGALNGNLDTEEFVNLLDKYVSSRIESAERKNSAQKETQKILDSMKYSKNPKTSFIPPKKRLDEMTPQEVDEMLDRLI